MSIREITTSPPAAKGILEPMVMHGLAQSQPKATKVADNKYGDVAWIREQMGSSTLDPMDSVLWARWDRLMNSGVSIPRDIRAFFSTK